MSERAVVDLDPESRRALELDLVLELLAGYAVTPLGVELVRGLTPLTDRDEIEAEHVGVEEAARHLSEFGRLVSSGLPDPGAALAALPIEGRHLPAVLVRDLAVVLLAGADLRSRLSDLPAEHYPRLLRLGKDVPDLSTIARPIVRGVLPDGRLADEASPELARIRASIARIGESLRRMLESLLRDPTAQAVIRDDFITQRNNRFVIPVRSDAPRPVEGIVHASSSSGATLFVEPMESVPLNNDLVRLAEAETEEQERVIAGWTASLRGRAADVAAVLRGVARADSFQARAEFARLAGASRPRLAPRGGLRLEEVRHPLLDRRLAARGERAVASTLELGPEDRVLVLSGPNAGGKTVALKTIGLAAVMAQAGIPVCAAAAELPIFRQVRADIGDHQSIDADLSTFSAHVQALAGFLDQARAPALLLFDEIGTGTDPAEGAALARAVLERLAAAGLTTVATTHHASVKAWAFTTPGAVSAALEFDSERLRPTYRVLQGAAGVSAGIEIATRLGLPSVIVDRARSYLEGPGVRAEEYLERLRALTAEAEKRRADVVVREEELEAERRRLSERAALETERRRREAAATLESALREFRDAARAELAAIQDQKERSRLEKTVRRAELRLAADLAARRVEAGDAGPPPVTGEAIPGSRVLVYSLGKVGEVVAVRGDRAEVRLGKTTFTVARSDLRVATGVASEPSRSPRSPGRADRPVDDLAGTAPELMLIGKTVEEGLADLDKFLDDSTLSGAREVRIVHGHGTGRLRAAVRRFLAGHAHVESHRPGGEREGGDGATVALLR